MKLLINALEINTTYVMFTIYKTISNLEFSIVSTNVDFSLLPSCILELDFDMPNKDDIPFTYWFC